MEYNERSLSAVFLSLVKLAEVIKLGIIKPKANPANAEIIHMVITFDKGNKKSEIVINTLEAINIFFLKEEFKEGFMYEVERKVKANSMVESKPTIELGKDNTYLPSKGTVVVTMLFTDLAETVIRTKIIAVMSKLLLLSVIANLNC